MSKQNGSKLKWLEQELPEGLIVTSGWLEKHGFSRSLRSQYLAAGWLQQPARGVFRRPRGDLRWEQVVVSLQTLLAFPVVVGGRTALEHQGYAHFLSLEQAEVHLYGKTRLPGWMHKLPLSQKFVFHKSERLFKNDPITRGLTNLSWNIKTNEATSADPLHGGFNRIPWGQWDWPLTLSTPERALFELLDELPGKESFHVVDKLAEGLASLSPNRLNKLLADCRSVKVKRLFFFFADRHKPAWLKRIDREAVALGKGDRMLVRGGKLDPVYRITVPGDLDAV
ncbi:MAG: type IV toxin-antitoxin system AbiEi family antitoxin domain-containing protein [Alphaproteobacteria bacterium]|uniref:type IV toxin-antitoxin system AbiEi family antitoxin domain-containing protein n=1 Tax=Roseibium sp. TaxID=1936156 RepID=UPI003275B8A8